MMRSLVRGATPEQVRFVGLLTAGHVVIHWHQALMPVVIPTLKASLGLSDVQVGTISAARQLTTAMLNLPAGMVADSAGRWRAAMLAFAILIGGVGYTIIGFSPSYAWVLAGALCVGLGTSVWHPPAMAALSTRFPAQKGMALGVHGTGATASDTLSPILVGALLAAFAWQGVLAVQILPAAVIAFVLWRAIAPSLREARPAGAARGASASLGVVAALARRPVFMGITAAFGLWTVGRVVILTFLPIYLQQDLGYSTVTLGLTIGLLNVLGIVSQTPLGMISDRFGRKVVLVPSYALLGVLYCLLAWAPPGLGLSLVIGAIGVFFYALGNIVLSAVFDVVAPSQSGSAQGLAQVLSQLVALPAPIVAGLAVGTYGIGSTFIASGALALVGALILVPLPLYRGRRVAG